MMDDGRRQAREAARQRARDRTRRQRRVVAAAAIGVAAVAGLVVLTGTRDNPIGAGGAPASAESQPRPQRPQLPGGGRTLLPTRRIVAYYGAPQDPQLGELGIGSPAAAGQRLIEQAAGYEGHGRPVQPAFELIATIVTAAPGTDGKYRMRQSDEVIDRYLEAARKIHALLVLDIQPGRARFMDEVRAYEPYLREPDVGLALDPEWSMRPGQLPGQVIGSTDASIVNRVSRYLSQVVADNDLPQKLLIVHQFTPGMIHHRRLLEPSPGVALVVNVDGFGDRPNKISKYHAFARTDGRWFNGFKLFYHEDVNLMSPRQVLRLRPQPDLVVYE